MNRRWQAMCDTLGRTAKTEVLNANNTVYSTVKNTYNIRDQITNVRQYQGADTSTTFQDTDLTYDGHARLKARKAPIESSPTSYDYNADDTVQKRAETH